MMAGKIKSNPGRDKKRPRPAVKAREGNCSRAHAGIKWLMTTTALQRLRCGVLLSDCRSSHCMGRNWGELVISPR
jgi:hypothetical protein